MYPRLIASEDEEFGSGGAIPEELPQLGVLGVEVSPLNLRHSVPRHIDNGRDRTRLFPDVSAISGPMLARVNTVWFDHIDSVGSTVPETPTFMSTTC
jgi:hypothetical protein